MLLAVPAYIRRRLKKTPRVRSSEPQEAEDAEDEGLGHDDPRGMAAQVLVVEAIVELDDARRCEEELEPVGVEEQESKNVGRGHGRGLMASA